MRHSAIREQNYQQSSAWSLMRFQSCESVAKNCETRLTMRNPRYRFFIPICKQSYLSMVHRRNGSMYRPNRTLMFPTQDPETCRCSNNPKMISTAISEALSCRVFPRDFNSIQNKTSRRIYELYMLYKQKSPFARRFLRQRNTWNTSSYCQDGEPAAESFYSAGYDSNICAQLLKKKKNSWPCNDNCCAGVTYVYFFMCVVGGEKAP